MHLPTSVFYFEKYTAFTLIFAGLSYISFTNFLSSLL